MLITDENVRSLRDAFQLFAVTEAMEGRTHPRESDWEIVCERAKRYGAPQAKSAYRRAIVELEREKLIKLHKAIEVPPAIPLDFEEQVRRMTATELRVRLSKDQCFADLFGRWSAGEHAAVEVEDEFADFSAAQWRSLPPTTACRLMNNPRFRAAIDRLTSRGEI